MSKSQIKYELNEKDIDTVLGILKRIDPERANPEMAITILENTQAAFHELSHTDPKKLEEMYKELIKDNKKKSEK